MLSSTILILSIFSTFVVAQKSFLQVHYFANDQWADSNVCANTDSWKVSLQSRIDSCANSTSTGCVTPWEYRINLLGTNQRVTSSCSKDDAQLNLPVENQNVAIVKFYSSPLCESSKWEEVYAIRNSNDCMKNFLNDSVAEGTKDGFIKVTCPGTGSGVGRISFFKDDTCKTRIASDLYTGPGYIDLNDRCFKGTNFIRAYCQESIKVNEESTGEKITRECKDDPNQDKCKVLVDEAKTGNGFSIQIPNLMVFAFITFICSLLF
jgi:hypothetical protein